MKTIRSLMTLVGLSVVIFALSAIGARAQTFNSTQLAGTFTLPFEAQWGAMTLPAGDYNLIYGTLSFSGASAIEVVGKAKGSPQGYIIAGPADQSSAARNSLICVRDGDALAVGALEMPAIGKSVHFWLPRGGKLLAHKQKHGQYTLAEAPMLIQRVPVELNGK